MAARWEMQAMNMYFDTTPTISSAAGPTSIFPYGLPSADTLRIEDLLDFTNLDLLPSSSNANANADTHHTPPPPVPTAVHDSVGFPDDHFIPCEEAAELEWLSQFVEDSFSSNPYPPIPAVRQAPARSKRSSSDYHGRQSYLMHGAGAGAGAGAPQQQPTSSSTSSSSSEFPSRASGASSRRKRGGEEGDGGARRCTHCASEKTPQWRTGPMGPKTLCNACGVRYKSGRLVPEYRPASSPTFVLTQHSNSHRKVMELRRQKEHVVLRHHDGGGASEMMYSDYEVC